MLGIPDILVRIRIIRSSDQWIRIRIRIRLLSSLILWMQKNIFSYFFLITCLQAHHLQFKKLLKFCVKMIICRYQSAQHIYEKREGSGSGSVPLTNGSGSEMPKKCGSCGSGSGSGSPTLQKAKPFENTSFQLMKPIYPFVSLTLN